MSETVRFAVGEAVRVRAEWPPGHIRTPWYVRGRAGRIERHCGVFPNPEELAYHRPDARRLALYRVRFAMRDLWEEVGDGGDTLDAEIFEHWLEPVRA